MLVLLFCSAQGLVGTLVSCRSPRTNGRMDRRAGGSFLMSLAPSASCLDAAATGPASMLTAFPTFFRFVDVIRYQGRISSVR